MVLRKNLKTSLLDKSGEVAEPDTTGTSKVAAWFATIFVEELHEHPLTAMTGGESWAECILPVELPSPRKSGTDDREAVEAEHPVSTDMMLTVKFVVFKTSSKKPSSKAIFAA